MKIKTIVAALALTAILASCAPKQAENTEAQAPEGEALVEQVAAQPSEPVAPSRALLDSVSYFLGIDYGLSLQRYDFGKLNTAKVAKGIKKALGAKSNPSDPDFFENTFKVSPEVLNDCINRYLQSRHEYVLAEAKSKGAKFMKANLKKEGVVATESGLQYKIIEEGDAECKPAATDTVFVRYEGKLLDGTVFDSVAEDADPVRFPLNSVIKGWTEGIQFVGKGGKIQLFIPSDLAYGERGSYPTIGPNETLVFEVSLVDVAKAVEAEPQAPAAE